MHSHARRRAAPLLVAVALAWTGSLLATAAPVRRLSRIGRHHTHRNFLQ